MVQYKSAPNERIVTPEQYGQGYLEREGLVIKKRPYELIRRPRTGTTSSAHLSSRRRHPATPTRSGLRQRAGRHAAHRRAGENIAGHDCAGADERLRAHTDSAEDGRARADRSAALDHDLEQRPVLRGLEPTVAAVARGCLSFTNITPWPMNTSSSIVTPSQMKVWLWILQFAPIEAPRWISTNVPIRVLSPIRQP